MRSVACVALLLAVGLAGCTSPQPPPPPAPPAAPPPGFNPLVRVVTDVGDVWIEVFEEMVPLTAENFLRYATNRFYDGTKVHRVVGPALQPPDGFAIQMGDPNTRDPTKGRDTWGHGDPSLSAIEDEFHPALRHDKAGVVSMANAGPNTGTSQFFITLAPASFLDDKHAVFGRVVQGMEVVRAIGNVAVVPRTDQPAGDIVVRHVEVVGARREASQVTRGVEAWTLTPELNTTANRTFLVTAIARNTGNVRAEVNVTLEPAPGFAARVACPRADPPPCPGPLAWDVSAGASQVFFLSVATPPDAREGSHPLVARFRIGESTAEVRYALRVRALGDAADEGRNVTVHYIGMVPDGRLFDASDRGLAVNDSIPKFTSVFQLRQPEAYGPLPFQVGGSQVIRGFSDGARGLREGESRAVLIPPERAYGFECPPRASTCLAGRWLVFHVELVDVRP